MEYSQNTDKQEFEISENRKVLSDGMTLSSSLTTSSECRGDSVGHDASSCSVTQHRLYPGFGVLRRDAWALRVQTVGDAVLRRWSDREEYESPWRGLTPLAPLNPQHFKPWLAALASAEIPYWVDGSGSFSVILVHEEDVPRAREELDAYETRNSDWPRSRRPDKTPPLFRDGAVCASLLFEACLFRFYVWLEQTGHSEAWKKAGVWDVAAVRGGELWRNITALTLHGDAVHILSNVFWGFVFLSLVGSEIGAGFGLLLMLLSGVLGNFTMMFMTEGTHVSLGASTMVFGLLGVLSAVHTYEAWKRREKGHGSLIRLLPWVPLAAGIGMVTLYGGAPGTDVLAHILGFFWGCVFGALMPFCSQMLNDMRSQIAGGLFAVAVFFLGWFAAWR